MWVSDDGTKDNGTATWTARRDRTLVARAAHDRALRAPGQLYGSWHANNSTRHDYDRKAASCAPQHQLYPAWFALDPSPSPVDRPSPLFESAQFDPHLLAQLKLIRQPTRHEPRNGSDGADTAEVRSLSATPGFTVTFGWQYDTASILGSYSVAPLIHNFISRASCKGGSEQTAHVRVSICCGTRVSRIQRKQATEDDWLLCVTEPFQDRQTYYGLYNLHRPLAYAEATTTLGCVPHIIDISWASSSDASDVSPTLVCSLTRRGILVPRAMPSSTSSVTNISEKATAPAYVPLDAPWMLQQCLEQPHNPIPRTVIDIVFTYMDRLDILAIALGPAPLDNIHCPFCYYIVGDILCTHQSTLALMPRAERPPRGDERVLVTH